jgi:lipoprotein-anchoring transpeptidase ErfK/SrfK
MTNPATRATVIENLRSGIEAARTNQFKKARAYLMMVLDQEPDNIPAMFWLAFVAASPQESVELLERVLKLEPENERAKAGLRWAHERLQSAQVKPVPEEQQAPPATETDQTSQTAEETTRRKLLSKDETQQRAKKSALAHRARRTIDPLLGVTLIVGAVALLTIGLWALIFDPSQTLAAWFPVAIERIPSQIQEIPASSTEATKPISVSPSAEQLSTPIKIFSSKVDTIVVKPQPPHEAEPEPFTPIETTVEPSIVAPPPENPVSLSSPEFIGPAEELLSGPRLFQPVPASLLAHQPASPTEKWIEVNITKQRVTAWEGNTPVMSFLASTGLAYTPTVLGEYNIYWKLESTLMVGPDYYLPEVPYTMYFYAGYALHGAYWHNNFGQPMSHGCVNLSIEDSKKLFEWADPVLPADQTQVVATESNPGTLVVVHE